MIKAVPTWLIQVFSSRQVLHFDVPQVAGLGFDGSFGQLVLEGLQVLGGSHAVLRFRKNTDDAVAVGREKFLGTFTDLTRRISPPTGRACSCYLAPTATSPLGRMQQHQTD